MNKDFKASFKSGFLTLVGRPNTGKSTLMNTLVGAKIAITSPVPQTTRRLIRGVVTNSAGQIIVLDTPGLHKPKTLLGKRLVGEVDQLLPTVDIVGLCLPADEIIGVGDKYIYQRLKQLAPMVKILALVTKIDVVNQAEVVAKLVQVANIFENISAVVPVAAKQNQNIDELIKVILAELPSGPILYDPDIITDTTTEILVVEYIRQAALYVLRQELPNSLAVQLDEIFLAKTVTGKPIRKIYASLIVERESQKPIVIGKHGKILKQIGVGARKTLQHYFKEAVFLSLQVNVIKNWQQNPRALFKLGF